MHRIFAAFALAAGALTLGVSSAGAQQLSMVSAPRTIMNNFDAAALGPVLAEMGASYEVAQVGGQTVLVVSVPGGVRFVATPVACSGADGSNCTGLNLIALYQTKAPARTVEAFNYRYAFSSAGRDNDGYAYLSRYITADFGIPRGNIAVNVAVFVVHAIEFNQTLESAVNTVSQNGDAGDLAARHLNRLSASSALGLDLKAGEARASVAHTAALEAAPELIRTLIGEAKAGSKIANIVK